jgi:hypothetical protein
VRVKERERENEGESGGNERRTRHDKQSQTWAKKAAAKNPTESQNKETEGGSKIDR